MRNLLLSLDHAQCRNASRGNVQTLTNKKVHQQMFSQLWQSMFLCLNFFKIFSNSFNENIQSILFDSNDIFLTHGTENLECTLKGILCFHR